MEKELEELLEYFEDKKNVIDILTTLNDKYGLNEDILAIIISNYH